MSKLMKRVTKIFYNLIVAFLSVYIFTGCIQHSTSKNDSADVDLTYHLSIDSIVNLEKDGIMSPSHIITTSYGLVIGSDIRDSCSIAILSNNNVIKGIRYGGGPNEIYELTSLRSTDDSLFIYDSKKGILSRVIKSVNALTLSYVIEGIRLLDDAVMIDDNVMTIHVDKPYSYALSSKDRVLVDSLLYFPPSPKNVNLFTRSLNNTGSLACISPNKLFARCTAFDGGVDFFEISRDSIKHISRHALFNKDYSVGADGISPSPTEKTRMGYTQVKSSDSMFYASFSGDRAFDNPEGLTNEIHVFSPEGKILARYILDCNISEFDVSKDDSYIYALSGTDKCQIVRFNIQSKRQCNLDSYAFTK